MRLLDISIDNFLSVGHVDIDYRNQGLVLIEGQNHDEDSAASNGSGKSACISEPVLWCLYGITSRGVKSDAVVNAKVGSGTRVCLTFERDGKVYVVARHRKHKAGKNTVSVSCDGTDISRSTNDETDALIASIVGLSAQTFSYAVLLGQGMTRRITSLTDAGRKDIIEGLTKTDAFDRARIAGKRAAEAKSQASAQATVSVSRIEQDIVDLDTTLARMKTANLSEWESRCTAAQEAFDAAVSAWKAKAPAVQRADEAEKAARSDLDVKQKELAEFEKKLSAVTSDLRVVESKIENLNTQRKKLQSGKCPTCLRELGGKDGVAVSAAFQDAIVVLEAKAKPLRESVATITRARDGAVSGSSGVRKAHDTAQAALSAVRADAARLRGVKDQAETQLNSVKQSKPKAVDPALAERKKALVAALAQAKKLSESAQVEELVFRNATQVLQRARTVALTDAIEFLNQRVTYYSQILTDGSITAAFSSTVESKSGDTLDKIGLAITTAGGSYQSASGGEADRIDLAISFALHDLVCLASGQKHNTFVVDEPANYVDPVGLGRVRDLLEAKLEEGVETVLVASQNPAFSGMFETTWVIEKTDGISSLSVQ